MFAEPPRNDPMLPAEVSAQLNTFLQTEPDILIEIPGGSGLCSIANTSPAGWQSGFVSNNVNRWSFSGDPTKYLCQSGELKTCAAELFGTDSGKLGGVVCEIWETKTPITAIDVSKFPVPLQNAFYEDKGSAPGKWEKTHILLEALQNFESYSGIKSVYAKSASGDLLGIGGMVLATDATNLQLVKTGIFTDLDTPE